MERATRVPGAVRASEVTDPLVDFGTFVRASERKHKRLALLLTGDLHSAEDLLQAAYAKLHPRWDKVRTYDVTKPTSAR